jgi:electron transfer flavoprotein beta subunit
VTPQILAGLLDVPNVTFAKHLEVADGTIKIHRQTETGYNEVEAPLPALLTVTAGVNEPRYPSFKGIVGAKSKPVDQVTVSDLGLSPEDVKPTQEVANIADAPERGAGEVIEDDGTAAQRIADFLATKKVI